MEKNAEKTTFVFSSGKRKNLNLFIVIITAEFLHWQPIDTVKVVKLSLNLLVIYNYFLIKRNDDHQTPQNNTWHDIYFWRRAF